ncbi:MFS transporter [Paenibacillus sambharensis]|uniref:MFS transporter n=1 Tax=Paenibacillus sambharensis TaxID=1803190 RepID=A0A2W1LG83_9BACL|nr:MFS transporter [Paenibacillus sambharensis]PZD97699.1 MFS transporter [Paenibacillus sambharensis]
MKPEQRGALIALSSIPLIMTLGNSMLIPVLPEIRRQLQISSFQTSLIITVFSVMAIVLIPPAGYLSDRYGRKTIIVPSLILVGIGGGICATAAIFLDHAYPYMIVGRILQGMGAAGAAPIVMPLVGDMFKKEEQVSAGLGLIETSNTFGKVLSPVLGSFLASFAWFYPFLGIPILSAISVLLVVFLVKSPRRSDPPLPLGEFLHTLKKVFRREGRWLYAVFIIGGTGMFVLFAFLVYLSDALEKDLHLKGVAKGAVLAIPLAILCSASYITGKIIGENKKRMKQLVTGGFFLCAAGTTACVFTPSIIMQMIFLSAAGLGIGVALPCLDALITEGIEKEKRGTVTSFYSSMRFTGVAIGPPVASLLATGTLGDLFWTLTATSLISAILAWVLIRPGEKNSPEPVRMRKLIRPPSH